MLLHASNQPLPGVNDVFTNGLHWSLKRKHRVGMVEANTSPCLPEGDPRRRVRSGWNAREGAPTAIDTSAYRMAGDLVQRRDAINRELARNGVRFGVYKDGAYHKPALPL